MKKVQILFTAAALTFGLALAASAESCAGAKCCAQKGLQAGWFTGTGTLSHAGHDYKADGSCCSTAKADAKAAGCACGKSDGKSAAGSCCSGKSDGKAASEAGKCCGNCKK